MLLVTFLSQLSTLNWYFLLSGSVLLLDQAGISFCKLSLTISKIWFLMYGSMQCPTSSGRNLTVARMAGLCKSSAIPTIKNKELHLFLWTIDIKVLLWNQKLHCFQVLCKVTTAKCFKRHFSTNSWSFWYQAQLSAHNCTALGRLLCGLSSLLLGPFSLRISRLLKRHAS